MKFNDKLIFFKSEIEDILGGLLDDRNVYLTDLPYHSNIGDTLIWQGELDYFAGHGNKIIGYSSRQLCNYPILEKNTVIAFHGGGNLGDLYHEHAEFLFSLIEHYPNNRIIVFPQTVYYKDYKILEEDISQLNRHPDLHICARDRQGYEMLRKYGVANVYLLPDMAFCINRNRFIKISPAKRGSLLLKRVDGELKSECDYNIEADFIRDWPTFEKRIFDGVFLGKVLSTFSKYKIPFAKKIWNWYAWHVYRNQLVDIGVSFIKTYEPITTTRLHGLILALLCDKSVRVIDNQYGKLSSFINTWLSDVDEVEGYCKNGRQ